MKISTWTSVTLDGVIQGPGSPDEDTRGGFDRGGWGHRYHDEVAMREAEDAVVRQMERVFGHAAAG